MNLLSKHARHREIAREMDRTKLKNCVLLCTYVYGQPGGWYAVAHGSIDGFQSDYALILSTPGDIAVHPVRAFYVLGDEGYREELDEIRALVKVEHHMADLPPVVTLTPEEIEAARLAVKEALADYAAGRIDGVLVRVDDSGIEALESGTLKGGERVAKGDMLDDAADRLVPLSEEDVADWLRELCSGCISSDLSCTDWWMVAKAIRDVT